MLLNVVFDGFQKILDCPAVFIRINKSLTIWRMRYSICLPVGKPTNETGCEVVYPFWRRPERKTDNRVTFHRQVGIYTIPQIRPL